MLVTICCVCSFVFAEANIFEEKAYVFANESESATEEEYETEEIYSNADEIDNNFITPFWGGPTHNPLVNKLFTELGSSDPVHQFFMSLDIIS